MVMGWKSLLLLIAALLFIVGCAGGRSGARLFQLLYLKQLRQLLRKERSPLQSLKEKSLRAERL